MSYYCHHLNSTVPAAPSKMKQLNKQQKEI